MNEQRLKALVRANEIRKSRKEFKQHLAAMRPADALASAVTEVESLRPELYTMRSGDLLQALPRIGKVQSGKLLAQASAGDRVHLGALTERQRSALAQALAATARRRYGQEAIHDG